MKVSWKQIKIEIDGLPKTEKTLVLKKKAEDFGKEFQEGLERNIDLLWEKWKLAHKTTQMNLNGGFNGFVLGYELRNKEILGENKE